MQAILEQNQIADSVINRTDKAFGEKIGLFSQIFGCWHKEISRPFTVGSESYCACLHCGARQHFDSKNLTTYGSFHYPPTVSLNKN